ncbi:MAG TPA: zinc ribbon domain-containing protein [Nitrospiraceae bacterium]|jgi:putative FmdB family regulatory protein|nr:zinc ribbon domain-containing protein [Nitrospiraceae bacterium]
MPIYEYRCRDCGRRSSLLVLNISNPPPPACRHCRSAKLERVMSRFAAPKSEDARLESLADPSRFGDLDESDPKSMERFMKRMGQEMGEDLGGELGGMPDDTGEDAAEPAPTDMD